MKRIKAGGSNRLIMEKITGDNFPGISIIIPMRNEERYIARCLESIINQDYPRELIEVIVVDGGSTDSSIEIVEKLVKEYLNIKLMGGPRVNCPAAMNIGIRNAMGELISKVDAHGYIASDFLRMSTKYLSKEEEIKSTEEEYNHFLDELEDENTRKLYESNKELKQRAMNDIFEKKIFDFLVKNSKVKEKKQSIKQRKEFEKV